MARIDPSSTVAQIVLDHPETARVFTAHRIDYCCGGDVPLARVCAHRGIDLGSVVDDLDLAVDAAKDERRDVDPRTLDVSSLVARIVDRHHAYLRTAFALLEPLARKVERVHGEHDHRLAYVAEKVAELRTTLEAHLDFEEAELFPALLSDEPSQREMVTGALATMFEEHQAVGERLDELRLSTDDYAPPSWACASYRTLLRELARLDEDTMHHVHVENHVLMPRFVAPRTHAA